MSVTLAPSLSVVMVQVRRYCYMWVFVSGEACLWKARSFNEETQILFGCVQSGLTCLFIDFYQTSFLLQTQSEELNMLLAGGGRWTPLTPRLIALQNLVMWVNHAVTAVAWQQRKAPRSLVGWLPQGANVGWTHPPVHRAFTQKFECRQILFVH